MQEQQILRLSDIIFLHAGTFPGARVSEGSSEAADEQAGENSHETTARPCQELGGREQQTERNRVCSLP